MNLALQYATGNGLIPKALPRRLRRKKIALSAEEEFEKNIGWTNKQQYAYHLVVKIGRINEIIPMEKWRKNKFRTSGNKNIIYNHKKIKMHIIIIIIYLLVYIYSF